MSKAKAPTSGTDENGLAWEDVEVFGITYRLREITVPESDTAFDASLNPDKTFNARLNQRMGLVSSIVSPRTTIDDIGTWGVRKLVMLLTVYERLNSLPAADAEGKRLTPEALRKYVDGRGEIHGYLTDRELTRAIVAKWWGTTPSALRNMTLREYREMTEFMYRSNKEQQDAIDAAKMGLPAPTKGPKDGDTILGEKKPDRW